MTDASDTDLSIEVVDDASRLEDALASVAAPVVGVDVERADAHRYFRTPALIQIGVPGRCILIDPLGIEDLSPVHAFFADKLAILHAIENDIVPLEAVDIRPPDVADTAIAANLLGLPPGLGPLLIEILGVELSVDKEKFQRADWELRPLPQDMADYAAGDVVDLPELWAEMARRLEEAGRTEWYRQELEYTIANALEDTRHWGKTKGTGRLDPQSRTVLRTLWERREEIARDNDIAPQRLLRDEHLVELATDPPSSSSELIQRVPRRGQARKYRRELYDAVRSGQLAEPEESSRGGRRQTDADRTSFDRMRKARSKKAEELGIDAGVLCSSRPLWAAILSDPASPEELCEASGLRPWQQELLGELLWDAYLEGQGGRTGNGVDDDADDDA